MFTGIGAVSIASYVDPTKPRLQPERPTNVDLPTYPTVTENTPTDWTTEATRPDFKSKYTQLKRPTDISGKLIADFNWEIAPPTPVETLVPFDKDGRRYIPPADEGDVAELAERTQKNQPAYAYRHLELKYDNDVVYRTVCRAQLPDGMDRIRLASFRNFFSALENMSEHWETDLDHYFVTGQDEDQDLSGFEDVSDLNSNSDSSSDETPPVLVAPVGAPIPDATALNGLFSGFKGMSVPTTIPENPAAKKKDDMPVSPTSLSGMTKMSFGAHLRSAGLPPSRTLSNDSATSSSSSEADIPIPMYRGRRISTGIKMPGLYRTETVKGFMEAALFNFNCKLSLPRGPAALIVGGIRVPVRHQTFLVHRIPTDRAAARQGVVEGPVMGSFVRQDVEAFSEGNEQRRQERLQLDVLKEMGCLLHLAQERRRQGRKEKIWHKKAPKAGHWFSEMASDKTAPEEEPVVERGRVADATERKRKKAKTKYEAWKEMQPQRALWDPKVRYTAIGKEEGSDWDEVYMLSSMYHHVSLLRLRVHGAYIDYIADGTLPDPLPADPKWSQPLMQRSQWFDLFDITQRVEAFRCLWGIMCYLTRSQETAAAASAAAAAAEQQSATNSAPAPAAAAPEATTEAEAGA